MDKYWIDNEFKLAHLSHAMKKYKVVGVYLNKFVKNPLQIEFLFSTPN